ncbi:cell-division initiation protein [Gracilibacillus halophilus YIM-C55.5]|uniref:Cell-division initiation protein n=1 Tax=Gracilibacillus halophilus YIM-C55.5 TaxID=1308866 RepID=N4WND4_9BACI|nr:septum formation initiator family protein [Gracilibacillus halophilus]ENH97632.1 cell-division initiation protein [Gracilibacillus halophilus YIM-C55.5]
MPSKSNVSHINEAYIQQHDAHLIRQQKRKKKLKRRLALFAAIVVATVTIFTTYHLNQRAKLAEMQTEYEELSHQLTNLEKEEKQLTEEVELLNDEEYLLQIAKTNYFFTEEGEIVFKLPEEDPSY